MSVHSTHCCKDHGCKYNDPLRPVVSGQEQQAYPCEDCGDNSLFNRLQQARREGWEQCQREADSLLLGLIDVVLESKPVVQSARRAIAAMEYREKAND